MDIFEKNGIDDDRKKDILELSSICDIYINLIGKLVAEKSIIKNNQITFGELKLFVFGGVYKIACALFLKLYTSVQFEHPGKIDVFSELEEQLNLIKTTCKQLMENPEIIEQILSSTMH